MTTTDTGRHAEQVAAHFLQSRGYTILEQNWKMRLCEIDIVARKDNCVHCVEVKYRQNDVAGAGLEYITSTKLKQMHFAAEHYAAAHDWTGDINLAAIEVGGAEFEITQFIETIY